MNKCPDKCSGGDSSRQKILTDGQKMQLSESAQKVIEESTGNAYRCNYCGCVYLSEILDSRKLGDLDGGVTGQGWKSSNYP